MIDLQEAFERLSEEHDISGFDLIENPLHRLQDVCAIMLIDKVLPFAGCDAISAAEHDQIWLDVDAEKLAEVATEKLIIDLLRCGVFYDADSESLSMFR